MPARSPAPLPLRPSPKRASPQRASPQRASPATALHPARLPTRRPASPARPSPRRNLPRASSRERSPSVNQLRRPSTPAFLLAALGVALAATLLPSALGATSFVMVRDEALVD